MDYKSDLLSIARLAKHKKLLGPVDLTMTRILFSCNYTEEHIITGLDDHDNFELWVALSMQIIKERQDLINLMLKKLDKILVNDYPDSFEHPYFFSTRILNLYTGPISYLKSHAIIARHMEQKL